MSGRSSTFAGLVVLGVVDATIIAALKRLERHVLRWRTSS
jgi:ABC-type nitrate/sulfonate/bicarbonate transport system permease component